MIDWNGNGKIDPVDIGISMSASQDNKKNYPKKQGGGCLTSCLMVVSFVVFAVMLKR